MVDTGTATATRGLTSAEAAVTAKRIIVGYDRSADARAAARWEDAPLVTRTVTADERRPLDELVAGQLAGWPGGVRHAPARLAAIPVCSPAGWAGHPGGTSSTGQAAPCIAAESSEP